MLPLHSSCIIIASVSLNMIGTLFFLLCALLSIVALVIAFKKTDPRRTKALPAPHDETPLALTETSSWREVLQHYVNLDLPECIVHLDWTTSPTREHPVGVELHVKLGAPLLFSLATLPHHGLATDVMMQSTLSKEHTLPARDWWQILLETSSLEPALRIQEALFSPTHQNAARVESIRIEHDTVVLLYRFAIPAVPWRHALAISEEMPRVFAHAEHIHALQCEHDPEVLTQRMLHLVARSNRSTGHPLLKLLLTSFSLTESRRARLIELYSRDGAQPARRSRRELLETRHPTLEKEALKGITYEELAELYDHFHDALYAMLLARRLASLSQDMPAFLASGTLRQVHLLAITREWMSTLPAHDARQSVSSWFDAALGSFSALKSSVEIVFTLGGELWSQTWLMGLVRNGLDELKTHNPEAVYALMVHPELSEPGRHMLIDYFTDECISSNTMHLPYLIRKTVFSEREPTQFSDAFIRRLIDEAPIKDAISLAAHGSHIFDGPVEIAVLESLSGSTISQTQLGAPETRALVSDILTRALEVCRHDQALLARLDDVARVVLSDRFVGPVARDIELLQSSLKAYTDHAIEAPRLRQSALSTLTLLSRQSNGIFTPHYDHARQRLIERFGLAAQQGGLSSPEASDAGALSLSHDEKNAP